MSGSGFRALAPGKVNLCLLIGPVRPSDGRHELVSLVESVSLADELTLEPAEGSAQGDEVLCPGVEEPNLAAAALAAYRAAASWDAPPVRLRIEKRVPVAAGMGGGSGDAAAALRLAAHAAGRPGDLRLIELAPALGADVPSQLAPGLALMTGAGERVESLAPRAPHGLLILPSPERLATAAVYREADRLGSPRGLAELDERLAALRVALAEGEGLPPEELLVNDLEAAARSLCPSIAPALDAARAAGAERALVSGSGPTVFGLFPGAEGAEAATEAARELAARFPGASAATPVGPDAGAPQPRSPCSLGPRTT